LPDTIRLVYQALGNYFQLAVGSGRDIAFDFDIELFASTYKFKPVIVYNVLKILERDGYITLTDAMNSPSRAFFLAGKDELYKFQVENRESDRLIKVLLRSYSGLFTDFTPINEYEIARRMSSDKAYVVEQLEFLKKAGLIDLVPQKSEPQLVFNCERIAPEDIGLSKTYYFERKKEAAIKLEKLIGYLENESRCRSIGLLEYFGDTSGKDCGVCDICLLKKRSALREDEFAEISKLIFQCLEQEKKNLRQLVGELSTIREEKVIDIIRLLIDNGSLLVEDEYIILPVKK
jgi:ATP-dependent DNA helicase RecQ